MNTLVIDTSFGSTVGIVGHEPVVERDSRTHVERLQIDIGTAINQAGLQPSDIGRIVVGIGPAPFTGLRAGIVTAKALAFATGAELLGQDILSAQIDMMAAYHHGGFTFPEVAKIAVSPQSASIPGLPQSATVTHATLAVNDARRKQLYFTLLADADGSASCRRRHASEVLIDMDIDYPQRIAERVKAALRQRENSTGMGTVVDIVGHGAGKYAECWSSLAQLGAVCDVSVLDMGAQGLIWYADRAQAHRKVTREGRDDSTESSAVADSCMGHCAIPPSDAVEPLYLRRPDVSVPNPLKHVLRHAGADRAQ